jgi:PAS domain S-box-containing protein
MSEASPERSTARRLTLLYCAALGTVALLSIIGQVIVQEMISRQRSDSSVINVAGRQRMLSQRIAKAALAAAQAADAGDRARWTGELSSALDLWRVSHETLVGSPDAGRASRENSAVVAAMFAALEPSRAGMAAACEQLLGASDSAGAVAALAEILRHESDFLERMDAIVFQYEAEARERVERLRRLEGILLAVTLTVLALEGAFVFRPAVNSIRRTMRRLGASEAEREEIAAQLGTIFDSVPALILYHDREGKIIRVNKSGAEIIGESLYRLHGSSVYAWFPDDSQRFREEDAWIVAHGQPRLGLLHFLRNSQGDIRWLRMNKVPFRDRDGAVIGVIVFAVDVSAHKRLEKRLMELRADEQRRLGYDLHDGLGQHLSGILYLSRRLENRLRGRSAPEADGAAEIVNLVKQSIESVRGLSQGLRPLGDEPRALASALAELARATRESTGIDCGFEEQGTVLLFESDGAEHLFRIAQEAVNNAVRHSGGTRIRIRLTQGDDATVLEVSDDGRGMPPGAWQRPRPHGRDPEGLGLGIMEHRAGLMGAAFAIEAGPEGGAVVRCTMKI